MGDGLTLFILIGIMLVVMFAGSPVFSALGFTGLFGVLLIFLMFGINHLPQWGTIAYSQGTSFNQIIAPMFVMMSEFLSQGRIAEDIFTVMNRAVRKVKGGLAVSTTLACTVFSALCGSSPATAASVGRISIQEMTKRGYDPGFAVGTVAAGGTLGIMLPPSITFCFFGLLTETSIVQLFMAGVIPGFMISLLFIIFTLVRVRVNPALVSGVVEPAEGPKGADEIDGDVAREIIEAAQKIAEEERAAKNGILKQPQQKKKEAGIITILPALVLIVVVVAAMYSGIATPMEAAGYGVVGSLVITLIQRRMNKQTFSTAMRNTARTGTMIFFLIMCGFVMTYAISYLGISQSIASAVVGSGLNRYVILIIVYLLWLVIGLFMDPASVVILTVPFLFPSLVALGFDPIWIGVVSVICSEVGMITPPVGLNLFVIKAISNVPMSTIIKGSFPYVFVLIFALIVITLFPDIALLLPRIMT